MQSFPFALHPLFLLLYILAIKRKTILPLIFALLASFVLAPAFQNITYVATLWFLIIAYSFFYIYYNRTKKDFVLISIFFGILFFGWILIQSWWIALYFRSTAVVYSSQAGLANENLGTLLGVSKDYPLPSIIRLIHEGYFFRDAKFGDIYKSVSFQLISWLIPIVSLFAIKYLKENKSLKFFGIIFIIGLIVSLGANFPFGPIFTWFFTHIPPLQVLRNPFEKFGLVLTLGYSVLFAFGVMHLSRKANKGVGVFIAAIVMISVLGIYSWPLWTGRAVSGIDKKVGIIVPSYYKDLKDWIYSQQRIEGHRLLMLPIASGEGVVYKWGDRLYNGYPPSEYLIDYPSISSTPRFAYLYDYLHALRKYISQMDVAPAISLLGIKYIVDRQDMVMISQAEKDQKNYLLDTIYPSMGIAGSQKIICKSPMSAAQVENSVWLMCEPIDGQTNWRNVKYLHLKVAADVDAVFEVAVRDSFGNRPRWDGNADPAYSLNAGKVEEIIVPLGAPTEYNDKIDFADIKLIEFRMHPKDTNQTVGKVDIEGLWLDSGKGQKIDEYSHVGSFDKLALYQNNKFNSPPHFGILMSIEKVDSFKELFEKAQSRRSEVDKIGFLLLGQNDRRDPDKIASSEAVPSDSSKITSTKYFIKVDNKQPFNLILSELFDSNWKVIPDVKKEDLDGNFLNNLKLLGKSVLDESNHFVINGYANLWSASGESDRYAVVFRPQLIRDVGYKAVLYLVGILFILAIVLIIRNAVKVKRLSD